MSTPNGHRAYRVSRSPDFDTKLAARSSYQPSLDRVIQGVEWSLGRDAQYNARNVLGDLWVTETPLDVEAPVLWIYYTLTGERVILRTYHVVSE